MLFLITRKQKTESTTSPTKRAPPFATADELNMELQSTVPRLRELALECNHIGNLEPLRSAVADGALPALELLVLDGNDVSSESEQAVSDALKAWQQQLQANEAATGLELQE